MRLTNLLNSIKPYAHYLEHWVKDYSRDELVEKIAFRKNEITICFEEDLREHNINFTVLNPNKRIVKVYFGECQYVDPLFESEDLFSSLSALTLYSEKSQMEVYFRFLIVNKII